MLDRRHQPLLDCWVLVAKSRGARPIEWVNQPERRASRRCPFCSGNEVDTPPALAEFPTPSPRSTPPPHSDKSASNWRVRVVANKYPAVHATLAESRSPDDTSFCGEAYSVTANWGKTSVGSQHSGSLFHVAGAYGEHEVVIESPRHVDGFGKLHDDEARWSVRAWQERLAFHARDPRWSYGLLIKNYGIGGGASLEHVHSQVLATQWIPSAIRSKCGRLARWRQQHGACLVCRLMEQEQHAERRIVASTPHFTAYCPFASRFAWETWVVPRVHAPNFASMTAEQADELGDLLRQLLQRVEGLPTLQGYNFWLHTAPYRWEGIDESLARDVDFHWHLEIAPRVNPGAGFEWGGGDFINTVPPEEAAEMLRFGR